MIKVNNLICAKVGYYLRHKTKNMIGFKMIGELSDYEELEMNLSDIVRDGSFLIIQKSLKIKIASSNFYDLYFELRNKLKEVSRTYEEQQSLLGFAKILSASLDIEVNAIKDIILKECDLYYEEQTKECFINGNSEWASSSERQKIMIGLNAEANKGIVDTVVQLNKIYQGKVIDFQLLLNDVEYYSKECWKMCVCHRLAIQEVEVIELHDYTAGYPPKIDAKLTKLETLEVRRD
jgi:hypothetical protein